MAARSTDSGTARTTEDAQHDQFAARSAATQVNLNTAVIEVGGFGMLIQATPQTLATLQVGREALVHTSMVVREDSMTLFGFASRGRARGLRGPLGVSGVGPRTGLAILAVHTPEDVRIAATTKDTRPSPRSPGIGPKGAQRIVLELSGQAGAHRRTGHRPAAAAAPSWEAQVLEALTGLGWTEKDAIKAAGRRWPRTTRKSSPPAACAEILRAVLRSPGHAATAPGNSGVGSMSRSRRRLTNAGSEPEERVLEAALRPKNLDDFVGQERVRQQLSLVLEASKIRGAAPTTCCSRAPRAWARPRCP